MAFSGSQITRLGIIGITRGLYGPFAGKALNVAQLATGVLSFINNCPTGVSSPINDDPTGVASAIISDVGILSFINSDPTGVASTINSDPTGVGSKIS